LLSNQIYAAWTTSTGVARKILFLSIEFGFLLLAKEPPGRGGLLAGAGFLAEVVPRPAGLTQTSGTLRRLTNILYQHNTIHMLIPSYLYLTTGAGPYVKKLGITITASKEMLAYDAKTPERANPHIARSPKVARSTVIPIRGV
jgi:hypothetical protein